MVAMNRTSEDSFGQCHEASWWLSLCSGTLFPCASRRCGVNSDGPVSSVRCDILQFLHISRFLVAWPLEHLFLRLAECYQTLETVLSSLLDPADNIRDEVSSRIQYRKSLVVAIGFHIYQQFSCQVREPIFPLCVLARHRYGLG